MNEMLYVLVAIGLNLYYSFWRVLLFALITPIAGVCRLLCWLGIITEDQKVRVGAWTWIITDIVWDFVKLT